MKKIVGIFSVAIFYVALIQNTYAQQSANISGKVIDKGNSSVVPFAQVALFKEGDTSPVTGGTTDEEGKFSLTVAPGTYDVLISFVGYKDKKFESVQVNSDKKLGTIRISEATEVMEEVVVKGDEIRKPVTATMEGLEIRPDQTISNVGGTLLDILRNTPSVRVSDDGSVSLRGSSSTNVLLDGRNSAMTVDLEQIPASAIKSIQIINNPNAKYDAAAAGGVINIKLRQGGDLGTRGKAEVTMGTRMRTNANINMSHKTEKFALFGGYSYRNWPRVGTSFTERTSYADSTYLNQDARDERNDFEHTVNLGGDFYFGQNKLSYEGAFNKEDEDDLERTRTSLESLSGELIRAYTRDNNEIEENYTFDNALIYEYFFDDSTRSFRALASNSVRDQIETQNIDKYQGTINPEVNEPTGFERAQNDELRYTTILQADYVHPLASGKLEAGYKSTFRSYDNDYDYELYVDSVAAFQNLDSVSNRFLYEDQIHALYAIYSNSFGPWDIAVGTRMEQTIVDTKLFDTNETNQQRYLNFFPSVQTALNLNEENTVKATYSRRIDRPGTWGLNPFPDIADSLNRRVGDPNLQPEYINSFELGHMFNNGKVNLTTNLFYRQIDGQVDWIVQVEDGISIRGPRNLKSSQTYGFEIINATDIFEWWQINASYSFFGVQVDGTNIDNGFTNSGVSWYAKLTSDFKLPFDVDMQLTGNYQAPEIEAQGRDLARYYMDASLQRTFNDFNVSLTFRDVFNTRRFAGENFGADFEQSFSRNRETQIFLATVGYNFNPTK